MPMLTSRSRPAEVAGAGCSGICGSWQLPPLRRLVVVALLLVAAPAQAGPREIPVFRLAGPVTIDGRLDDDAWARLPAVTGFYKHTTRDFCRAKQTWVRVGWDSDACYLGVRCDEPDVAVINGSAEDNAQLWKEDCVEVFLLPPGAPSFSQFMINVNGARWDLVKSLDDNSLGADRTLDRWQGAAVRGDDFWSAELRIPFALLGVRPTAGDAWRGNVCRDITVLESGGDTHSTWAPLRVRFQEPDSFGRFRFGGRTAASTEIQTLETELNATFREQMEQWMAAAQGRVPLLTAKLRSALADRRQHAPAAELAGILASIEAAAPGTMPLADLVFLRGRAFRIERRINELAARVGMEALFRADDPVPKD